MFDRCSFISHVKTVFSACHYRRGNGMLTMRIIGQAGDQQALDTAMALPPLVLQALAHALDYLKAFSLETVLRVGAAFQPLSSIHEMSLSPNTLWYARPIPKLSCSALLGTADTSTSAACCCSI